jgi:hypothetical protein
VSGGSGLLTKSSGGDELSKGGYAMSKSALLIEWLEESGEGGEAEAAEAKYGGLVNTEYQRVEVARGPLELRKTLMCWAVNNPYGAVVYIGCHGGDDDLGPTHRDEGNNDGVSYEELWEWIKAASTLIREAAARLEFEKEGCVAEDFLDGECAPSAMFGQFSPC